MAVTSQGIVDPYLRQVIPLVETSCKTIQEITDLSLNLQPQNHVLECIQNIDDFGYSYIVVETIISRARTCRPCEVTTSSTGELLKLELAATYTEKLRNVLLQYFVAQGDLMMNENLSRKTKRLLDLKIGIDDFSTTIDTILDFYTHGSIGLKLKEHTLPSVEELKEIKRNICAVKDELKLNELHSYFLDFKDDLTISESHILCQLLGLDNKYGDYLDSLDDKMLDHDNVLYYILRFLNERSKELELDSEGTTGVCTDLVKLGFTQKGSDAIVRNIPDEIIALQIPSFWGERFLEYVFRNHPLLCNISSNRFPFSDKTIDCWFEERISTSKRDEPDENIPWFNVKMMNCSSQRIGTTMIEEYLMKLQDDDRESVFLFHGTTHHRAKSILEWGIRIGHGKDGLDFSSGDGIYLSENFKDAYMWGAAGRGDHIAVLVFQIKKDMLDEENILNLTEDKDKWEKIVKLCRTQYRDQKAFKNLLMGIKLIKGCMSVNPKAIAQGKEVPEGYGLSNIQICVRETEFSVKLGSLNNICCIIFF
ncbi:hypothetical protein BgiBS90_026059 [Biomphalaria glabrata]|nr:hypothetical protein BgiBS90_026059 [Biomphalaria glabrata]